MFQNAGGNVIFDGGSDMYDIGNVIVSSLMQHPVSGLSIWPSDGSQPAVHPVPDCSLGSIMYVLILKATIIY